MSQEVKGKIRIQKYIADSGVSSRRNAEKMILEKRIRINKDIATIGQKINPLKDKIFVDGKRVENKEKKYYIMLYKPRGFTSTVKDEFNRPCVKDLVKEIPARIYPVGRLDKDSEGLLLLTNDGDFSNKVIHPSHHLEKKYRVTVDSQIKEDQVVKLSSGMVIDGEVTKPAKINVLVETEKRSVFEIILTQGLNRQIRKMCEEVGLKVKRLKRTAIGGVKLGMLNPGSFRELKKEEIRKLLKI